MKLYLYGNCQVTALKKMMLEHHDTWPVKSFDVSAQTITPAIIEQHYRDAAAAELVICQPIRHFAGFAELSTATLLATLSPATQRIIIPSMFFDGTLPSLTYMPQRMPGWHMPYHDSHTVEMILRGYALDDIAVLLASPDLYSAAFVETGIVAGLMELRRREVRDQILIHASPILEEYGRSVSMMNAINHPNRFFLARILNAIYQALSLPQVAAERGYDHLQDPYLPPLPSVVAHLKLAGVAMDIEARGQRWTREAYLRQSFVYYGRIPAKTLLEAFKEAPGYRFIKSYRGVAGVMGEASALQAAPPLAIDVKGLIDGAFQALLRRAPSREETVAHSNAIHRGGIERWLSEISAAEEFTALHAGAPATRP